jgi:NAD(P)-dependent dehydrogenase (short-subunit alcohol dehydrogenase family)
LGKAAVELLASGHTHTIYFTYSRHKDEAAGLADTLPNTHALQADFTNDDHIDKLLEAIDNMDLDVLVNNAYVGTPKSTHFHKIDAHDFLDSFTNNIIPAIRITQKALEVFKKKKFGKIINVLTSSILHLPPIGYSIYAGNKAYLQQLSKVWNKEYARYNISSNCIAPEYMQTTFAEVDERILEQMTQNHPLQKLLTAQEVAQLIEFLITSSQQINGVTIPVTAAQCL